MNRFWKILREDDGIFDIVSAESMEDAALAVRAMFCEWHIVETTQDEWWSWSTVNWNEVDRLENDMVSLDTF